jgi:dihydroorotase
MLTKKDVFFNDSINPHHFCMPVVKDEKDLLSLRQYACSGNKKFFIGTDSAPHHINFKTPNLNSKPGIFSSPCSIELYADIFDQENSLINLEKFTSINGPQFYGLEINKHCIQLIKESWILPEYSIYKNTKIKNFMGGEKINWKIKE